jgi:uncharacterized UPF0160 family protein
MRLNHYCPWKDHLYNLEQEMGVEKPILFCLVRSVLLHFEAAVRFTGGDGGSPFP